MVLTEDRRARLLAYCRIECENPGDNQMLESLYNAAVSYLEQAGVKEPPEGSLRRAQYDLCVDAMVLDGWDVRGSQMSGNALSDNPSFRRTLKQLQLTEPVPITGTGSGEES